MLFQYAVPNAVAFASAIAFLSWMTMAQRHSLSSLAIDSVKLPRVATLGNEPDPERFPACDNEFGAELISHPHCTKSADRRSIQLALKLQF